MLYSAAGVFTKIPFYPAEMVNNPGAYGPKRTYGTETDSKDNEADTMQAMVAGSGESAETEVGRRPVALAIFNRGGSYQTQTDYLIENKDSKEILDPLRRTLRLDGDYGVVANCLLARN